MRARLLIEAAAAAGSAVAVAWCKANGWGGHAVDKKASFGMYRKAAEQGGSVAQFMLGFCYRMGIGVEVDAAEAVQWYRKAAEQGESVAQFKLGDHYRIGNGVEVDAAEAVEWYRKAAAQGAWDLPPHLYAL